MRRLSPGRKYAEYAIIRALAAVVLSLGLPRAVRLSRLIADLVFRLDERHRRVALDNLEQARPDLSPGRREEIAREAFRSFTSTIAEAVYIPRLLRRSSLHRLIDIHEHPEARVALRGGGGAVLVTAHFGNWEICGAAMGLVGISLHSIARPLDNPLLDRWVTSLREAHGQKIHSKHGAPRTMLRLLRGGGVLAILIDQNTAQGVFVSYFGRPASTTPAPATLALRLGIPVVPCWARRVAGTGRFHLEFEKPLTPPQTGDRDRDVLLLTQAMTGRIEAWVREYPEQWLWGHRRWKRQPRSPEEMESWSSLSTSAE